MINRNKLTTPPYDERNRNGEKICVWCGKPLTGRQQSWCSAQCVEDYRIHRTQARMARFVKKRDNDTCSNCGKVGNCEAHHVIPLCEGGPHTPDNVILLCVDCHKKAHSSKQPQGFSDKKKFVKSLKEADSIVSSWPDWKKNALGDHDMRCNKKSSKK